METVEIYKWVVAFGCLGHIAWMLRRNGTYFKLRDWQKQRTRRKTVDALHSIENGVRSHPIFETSFGELRAAIEHEDAIAVICQRISELHPEEWRHVVVPYLTSHKHVDVPEVMNLASTPETASPTGPLRVVLETQQDLNLWNQASDDVRSRVRSLTFRDPTDLPFDLSSPLFLIGQDPWMALSSITELRLENLKGPLVYVAGRLNLLCSGCRVERLRITGSAWSGPARVSEPENRTFSTPDILSIEALELIGVDPNFVEDLVEQYQDELTYLLLDNLGAASMPVFEQTHLGKLRHVELRNFGNLTSAMRVHLQDCAPDANIMTREDGGGRLALLA